MRQKVGQRGPACADAAGEKHQRRELPVGQADRPKRPVEAAREPPRRPLRRQTQAGIAHLANGLTVRALSALMYVLISTFNAPGAIPGSSPCRLSLGHRRGGRAARLRRHRRDVFAAGLPHADDGGDGLEPHRRLQRHDDRLSGDGGRQRRLGRVRRPLRAASGGARRAPSCWRRVWRSPGRRARCGSSSSPSGCWSGSPPPRCWRRSIAAVTGWFDTQRSLAVSLVSAGMGMAPMTMAPLAAWLIGRTRLAHGLL